MWYDTYKKLAQACMHEDFFAWGWVVMEMHTQVRVVPATDADAGGAG